MESEKGFGLSLHLPHPAPQLPPSGHTLSWPRWQDWRQPHLPLPLPPRCCDCSASLSHQYYEKDGQLFCKKDYWARYGESCHGCSEHITKGLVMVSALPAAHCCSPTRTHQCACAGLAVPPTSPRPTLAHSALLMLLEPTQPNNQPHPHSAGDVQGKPKEGLEGAKGLLSQGCDHPIQVAGELKYHPECFLCRTCGTFIGDGDTYTLVEHSKLYW